MVIMVAIDMHVKRLVCELGYGKCEPRRRTYGNDVIGHRRLLDDIAILKQEQKAEDALVAYEASGLGYVLYDRIREAGYRCAVMAPTELLRSASGYKKKTDKKDCSYIYETMRGHLLAGNRLHGIWVPEKQLRQDREVVRARFDVGQKLARVKVQIHTLLKKFGVQKPEDLNNWTKAFRVWLEETGESMGPGFRIGLETLLRQLDFLEGEQAHLRRMILALSQTERYRDQSEELQKIVGVGLITTMTFLTEMGDMMRFSNRRQVGSFMGLLPPVLRAVRSLIARGGSPGMDRIGSDVC